MKKNRRIKKVLKGIPTIEGAGVHLKRPFGYHQVPDFDPFLMLDDFHSSDPADYIAGFPWHPHRGIETITYIVEGIVEHRDSMGNQGIIGTGDVQWMTAGSGIVHQEMPQESATGRIRGFQLWANLPASHKMMPPRYRDIKASDIKEVVLDSGAQVKVISGKFQGVRGPVIDIIIEPELLDVVLPAGMVFTHQVKNEHTVFAYILDGEGYFGDSGDEGSSQDAYGPENAILYEHAGESITVAALDQGIRFLLVSGKPLHEPIAWRGPIVMNTEDELRAAFDEYKKGTFIR